MTEPDSSHDQQRTLRQEILAVLCEQGPLTVRDLAGVLDLAEHEVVDHLQHLRRSLRRGDYRLRVVPAECYKCGFVFEKRARFTKPGKCPQCRSGYIGEPQISAQRKGGGGH